VEIVALTLGSEGALLISKSGAWRAEPLQIEPVSVVGAGDSFLGALVWCLDEGRDLETALKYGVAAGSAALLNTGTELCKSDDVARLVPKVRVTLVRTPIASDGGP
jgi:6-phosphofructokinase 2